MKAPGFSYPLWLVFVSVLVGQSLLGGCVSQHRNLVRTGALSVRTYAPPPLRLSATVYTELDTFTVYGAAEEITRTVSPLIGHVDVEVRGPDGVLLYAQSAPYRINYTYRQMYRRGTFRARFPGIPPQGAVLTVRHHRGIHAG